MAKDYGYIPNRMENQSISRVSIAGVLVRIGFGGFVQCEKVIDRLKKEHGWKLVDRIPPPPDTPLAQEIVYMCAPNGTQEIDAEKAVGGAKVEVLRSR